MRHEQVLNSQLYGNQINDKEIHFNVWKNAYVSGNNDIVKRKATLLLRSDGTDL